eukprot:TRINITY_DN64141_c0_g1_i1.p2 TRINITY_DN64141_c0_g1~~TRINITY_DN64141_c0_g1_i1.p2  ORF type:complete len:155 (-),score=3.61 TRINITY_DN64141_c0_g1_i1:164-628(-)
MVGRIRTWFEEQGLSAADIPKAFVIHEVIGISFAIAAWSMCYAIQPSKTVMRPVLGGLQKNQKGNTLIKLSDKAMQKAQKTVSNMKWLQGSWLGQRDPARLTTSLAESICFRALVKPLTFTFKLWASWKLVLVLKRRQIKNQQQIVTVGDQYLQ